MAEHGQDPVREPIGPLRRYPDLRKALAWFRTVWQEDLPRRLHESASHVGDEDHLGGPEMTERFKAYIGSGVVWIDGEPVKQDGPRGPVRRAFVGMATSSRLEQDAARFLFALVCRDFDPVAAGLSLEPPLMPSYSPYYAEKAIARLAERMERAERQGERPWQASGHYREVGPVL